jgi:hypothetical protein
MRINTDGRVGIQQYRMGCGGDSALEILTSEMRFFFRSSALEILLSSFVLHPFEFTTNYAVQLRRH